MRIYLIGMPGCGKSTVGKELAKALNYEFIDLDTEIEKRALMFIPDIFERYGEKHFRILESDTLKSIDLENAVIATGGGIIKNKDNKEYMTGLKVYIEADLDEIAKRCEDDDKNERPLLRTNSIYDLYVDRHELYEYFKDIKVKNDDVSKCVKKIMKEVK